jgi:hypothetical protein
MRASIEQVEAELALVTLVPGRFSATPAPLARAFPMVFERLRTQFNIGRPADSQIPNAHPI